MLLAAARGHSFQLDAARRCSSPPSAAAASSSASRRSFEARGSPRRDRSSRSCFLPRIQFLFQGAMLELRAGPARRGAGTFGVCGACAGCAVSAPGAAAGVVIAASCRRPSRSARAWNCFCAAPSASIRGQRDAQGAVRQLLCQLRCERPGARGDASSMIVPAHCTWSSVDARLRSHPNRIRSSRLQCVLLQAALRAGSLQLGAQAQLRFPQLDPPALQLRDSRNVGAHKLLPLLG